MVKRAFTLIELIVVIAIIAILSAIIAPSIFQTLEKAKIARVVSDSKTVESAANSMFLDTGYWPGSNWDDDPTDPLQDAAQGEGFIFKGSSPLIANTWDGPYINKWMTNPWFGQYWWDYNEADQNLDGIDREHVLWIDNGRGNSDDHRIPLKYRIRIDEALDDGNVTNKTGRIQVWQGNPTDGNFGFILIQGN